MRWRLAIGAAAALALFLVDHFGFKSMLVTNILCGVHKETYAAMATIFGALLGFVITAFSIIAALTDTDVLVSLHERGDDKEILDGFVKIAGIVGLATICAFVGIFIDTDAHPNVIFEYIAFGVLAWGILAVATIVFLIDAIIRAVLMSKGDVGR